MVGEEVGCPICDVALVVGCWQGIWGGVYLVWPPSWSVGRSTDGKFVSALLSRESSLHFSMKSWPSVLSLLNLARRWDIFKFRERNAEHATTVPTKVANACETQPLIGAHLQLHRPQPHKSFCHIQPTSPKLYYELTQLTQLTQVTHLPPHSQSPSKPPQCRANNTPHPPPPAQAAPPPSKPTQAAAST